MGLLNNHDPISIAIQLVALAVCITIHEFAHAKRADLAGDPTPRRSGRLSLNPLDHYDPVGSTLILLFGIGWAKPVPVNPYNFRNPRRDGIMVALWGPLSNFLLAIVLVLVVKLAPSANAMLLKLLVSVALLSLVLGVFNLIPIPPLDGSHILANLLPYPQARRYELFIARYGLLVALAAILIASNFILPFVVNVFFRLLR
jgi:Zn-dependent protease